MESQESERAVDSAVNPQFFLVVTPGFEDLAIDELREQLVAESITPVRGGVQFEAPLREGLALNRLMKTPTRILLRLADFGCRDFPKLFRKISGFPWEDWFEDGAQVDFQASTRSSRLRMKKRIEETCSTAYHSRLKKQGVKQESSASFTVYVRFENDICTLSLDTSGEILHKRGLRPLSSDAPIRETMAASLLRILEKSGEDARGVQLVDPMTGGGTFLIEAALAQKVISTRSFAFEALKPWRTAKPPEPSRDEGVSVDGATPGWAQESPYSSFVGYDVDEKALHSAAGNLELLGETRSIELYNDDFLEAEPLPPGPVRWLIANPPYGERIRVEGRLTDFYAKLFEACERVARPDRACFVLPEKAHVERIRLPRGWRLESSRRFLNGGLPVVAVVFLRKS